MPGRKEPVFHCFQDDLDADDPRRDGPSFYCIDCRNMLWCEAPGEYMDAWFDTRLGPMCLNCFYARYKANPVYDGTDKWLVLDEWICHVGHELWKCDCYDQ